MSKLLLATEKPFDPRVVAALVEMSGKMGHEIKLLEKYGEKAELLEAVADAEGVIIRSDKIDEEVMNAAPNLKLIVRAGAGYDNVDLREASKRGIVVMNTPGQNSNAVAELVFGLMLTIARNKYKGTSGYELRGKRVGLQGYGNIGKYVSVIARGYGMEVCAFDPFVVRFAIERDGVKVLDSAEEMYRECDFISVQIPANETTHKLINYELVKGLKEGGCIINTARQEVIDEEGMMKALAERPDIKYAADIAPQMKSEFEEKFPEQTFFTSKKMGAQTFEANYNAGVAALKQSDKFFKHNDRTYQVNN